MGINRTRAPKRKPLASDPRLSYNAYLLNALILSQSPFQITFALYDEAGDRVPAGSVIRTPEASQIKLFDTGGNPVTPSAIDVSVTDDGTNQNVVIATDASPVIGLVIIPNLDPAVRGLDGSYISGTRWSV